MLGSLVSLAEFNNLQRNPKFRSKTELSNSQNCGECPNCEDMESPLINPATGRRHSLSITVGTSHPPKETVRQRTFTVPVAPSSAGGADTMSMKVSQKELNKSRRNSEDELINKNRARGRRSSEPVNLGSLKKRTGLLDSLKKKGLGVFATGSGSTSPEANNSGANTPTRKSTENLDKPESSSPSCSGNNSDEDTLAVPPSLNTRDSGANLLDTPIQEDWEAERIASGLEVIVKIGNTKGNTFETKSKPVIAGRP